MAQKKCKRRELSQSFSTSLPFLSCFLQLPPLLSDHFLPLFPSLTLDEVQLRQELQLLGDVQLEVSEGGISSQSEMLEILDRFTQPGRGKQREGG